MFLLNKSKGIYVEVNCKVFTSFLEVNRIRVDKKL